MKVSVKCFRAAVSFFAALLVCLGGGRFLFAQYGTTIPSLSHYECYRLISRGQFSAAENLCRQELGNATKVGQHRWIDSICYYAMLGESLYVQGDLAEALESFESAIDIYMNNPDWIARVTYPTGTSTAEQPIPPWGSGSRNLSLCVFPHDAMIRIGDPITDERLKQGGMMKNPELRKIDPEEIFRCTALALRRRNEILGPLSPSDYRSRPIVECFSKRAVSRNHWSSVLLDVLFGISLEGAGKHEEAVNMLEKSLVMEGQLDHFLAASALLTLGDIYIKNGKPFEAADSYYEASISAFAYGNNIEIEESVRKLMGAVRLREDPAAAEFPLTAALDWVSRQPNLAYLEMSFKLLAADDQLRHGEIESAENLLQQISRFLNSQGIGASRYGDLCNYLSAVICFQHRNREKGVEYLENMISGVSEHSLRFYQIHLLNTQLSDYSPRTAYELYDELLRISDFFDWSIDPAASFTADTSSWEKELGNMFLIALDRDQKDKAFEITERIRVRRFLTAFDMGGRLFSLRYLIAAPESNLTEEERTLRQNLLVDYPGLGALVKKSEEIKEGLAPFSIIPSDSDRSAKEDMLKELEAVSAEEEAALAAAAVMPFAIPEIFPARCDLETLRAMIPEKNAVLSFIEVDHNLYGFLVTGEIFDAWRLGQTESVAEELTLFLDACGAGKQQRRKDLEDESWKTEGSRFFSVLLGSPTGEDPRGSAQFEKLAVVPDSVLWYLPYEALCLPKGEDLVPMISVPNFTLICAPAVSLAFARGEAEKGAHLTEMVIAPGKLHLKETNEIQENFLKQISKEITKTALISNTPFHISEMLLASQMDQLLNLQEISSSGPDWSPLSKSVKREGKGKETDVAAWRYLPWGGPKRLLFPGFRSSAESRFREGGDGSEFFAPLLILESQGAETILISRWRVGGDSAYRLVNSFLRNAEKGETEAAWKESVIGFMHTPLNLKEEPSFKGTPPKETFNGESPFFWGGYMLVHRGIVPLVPALLKEPAPAEEEPNPENGGDAKADNLPESEKEPVNKEEKEESRMIRTDEAVSEENSDDTADASGIDDANSEESKQEEPAPKPKPAKPEPASKPNNGGSVSITDEQIEKEDRMADDFYKDN